jgi:hypothetical protein
MAVAEPPFTLEIHEDAFDVRRYPARVVTETRVTGGSFDAAGNEGFRRLAGYIFGGNRIRQTIAMTAPVGERRGSRDSPGPVVGYAIHSIVSRTEVTLMPPVSSVAITNSQVVPGGPAVYVLGVVSGTSASGSSTETSASPSSPVGL